MLKIRKKNADDGMKAIKAAFDGHKSMKIVTVVDEDIDITRPSPCRMGHDDPLATGQGHLDSQ